MAHDGELRNDEVRSLMIALHDDRCVRNCGDDISTYPRVGKHLKSAIEQIVAARLFPVLEALDDYANARDEALQLAAAAEATWRFAK